jgi:Xaa-Pro aminopeptidase
LYDAQIPTDEYGGRRDRARALAAERGLDALLVWSKGGNNFDTYGDVFYLANHYTSFPQLADNLPHWRARSHAGLLLPVDGSPTLVVDIPDPRLDLITVEDVRSSRDVVTATAEVIREHGLDEARVGLVAHETLLHGHYRALAEELPGVRWEPADEILQQLRLVKSDAEIAMLRQSSDVCVRLMDAMLEAARPGLTDGHVVGNGLELAAELGTQPWLIYMSSGPVSHHHQWEFLPTWNAQRPYESGDIVHPDIFGPYRGYFYDLQRSTVVGGRASAEQKRVLEASHQVVQHMIGGVAPGRTVDDIWQAGCAWLEDEGFGSPRETPEAAGLGTGGANFPGFGHQLGLAMERPFIMRGDQTVIEPNMVLAVEVDLGPEGCGAAYEDIVVVTDDGCETITAACRAEWWE